MFQRPPKFFQKNINLNNPSQSKTRIHLPKNINTDITTTMDNCIKKTLVIDKQNYYITVGKTFCHVTLPHENRNLVMPIMELVTQEISSMLEAIHEEKTPSD